DRGHALGDAVMEAGARKVSAVGHHTRTPARSINTTATAVTIVEPVLPPSSVSPTPASMNRWPIPATRWYSRADSRPQITSLASGLVRHAFSHSKLPSDAQAMPSP